MNAKEIDELFEASLEDDWEKIIKFADLEIANEDIENFLEENAEKILERLAIKIEQGDYDYFYSKIEDERYKSLCIDLLCYSSKVEDIKEIFKRREELKLENYDLIKLIKAIRDTEYIKEIIENKEKRKELGLKESDLIDLIKATRDTEYIREIIKNKEKREQLKLNSDDVFHLIKETSDLEYIKEIINNKEKREELGLDSSKLIALVIATKDSEYINEFLKSIENKQNTENSNQKVNLPNNMTIGIEIESEGINSILILDNNLSATGWKCKGDASLYKGVEVVSPILSGNTEQTSEEIKYVCRILNSLRSNCI